MPGSTDKKAILAIETSEIVCGVSLYFSDEKYFSTSVSLKHSHSEKIFEIIDSLFRISQINPEELNCIAVSSGPGSFTGLRIGMSAAKGMAYAAELPIVPVPTYEATAFQLSFVLPENTEFIVANKVNREEVYFARFKVMGNNYIFVDNLTLLKNEIFISKIKNEPVFGNAALLLNSKIRHPVAPEPKFVAKWAVEFGDKIKTFEYDFIEPNYMKNFIIKEKNK